MRLALLNGSALIADRIAPCIEEGIGDGSIAKMNAGVVAEMLYNMWLGATLMGKLQRSADGLLQTMQITATVLTSKAVE
jgi:TetR/AcrR family transcriptional regulator, transcriptional repressor for nem operon